MVEMEIFRWIYAASKFTKYHKSGALLFLNMNPHFFIKMHFSFSSVLLLIAFVSIFRRKYKEQLYNKFQYTELINNAAFVIVPFFFIDMYLLLSFICELI